jgi:hypothetical protein
VRELRNVGKLRFEMNMDVHASVQRGRPYDSTGQTQDHS